MSFEIFIKNDGGILCLYCHTTISLSFSLSLIEFFPDQSSITRLRFFLFHLFHFCIIQIAIIQDSIIQIFSFDILFSNIKNNLSEILCWPHHPDSATI